MNVGDTIELVALPGGKLGPAGDTELLERTKAKGSIEIENILNVSQIQKLHPGHVVVDAGAFIGDTTLPMLKLGCEVFAIEPFVDAFLCLQFNCRRAHCIHRAVGNGERVSLSPVIPSNRYGCRYVQAGEGFVTLRIDELHLEKCHLIKVDVEGWELYALRGAEQTIRRYRPLLIVEHYPERIVASGYTETDLTDYIKSLGYTMRMFGEPPRWDWICAPV